MISGVFTVIEKASVRGCISCKVKSFSMRVMMMEKSWSGAVVVEL